MTQPSRIFSLAAFLAALLLLPPRAVAQSTPPSPLTSPPPFPQKMAIEGGYGRLPLSFEANHGQTSPQVRFLSRGGGKTLFLTSTEAVLTGSDGQSVRMKLLGSNRNVDVVGLDKLPGKSNYFFGTDPAKWHTSVPMYARVRYGHIYPGVDLLYYGNQQELEYDFVIAPGADPRQIQVAIQGTREFFIDADGDAVLRAKFGDIRLKKPRIYQELNGKQVEVAGGYSQQGHKLRFRVGTYDHTRDLTIDPQLVYSTYLGGTAAAGDQAQAIAVDSAGNAYITGQTSSTDFPLATNSPQSGYAGGSSDAFVTKLNAAGNQLIYSTYLGGSAIDVGTGIAVDGSGNAYIAGYTNSTNFPVLAGLQMSNGGGYDAFVTKLSSDGSSLVYSTYLGGSHDENAHSIALDGSGNVYITGSTNSTDFPLSAALQSSKLSGASLFTTGFVTKLNAAGTAMVYSTYLGGSSNDNCTGIAVDSAGNAYVTGYTNSANFPVASPFQATLKGATNAFVSKLNAAGSALSYSTYLGGSSTDNANAIAVDSSGNALIAGYTRSADFPLSSPLQSSNAASESAFITKLNSNASALVYSTYLGGSIVSYANAIAVDSVGNAFVAGNTNSPDFPLSSPVQPVLGGAIDGFVTALTPTGSSLLYSTFLGGNGFESTLGIAVDGSGNAYVTGSTTSANFPVLSPYQASLRGGGNAFVAKINPLSASGTPTRTIVSSSQNPSVFGTSVTFTAIVTAASGTPSGTVNFTSGGLNVGGAILTNGQASIMISGLPLGSTSIMASYSGDAQFASSLSVPAFLQTVSSFASTTTLVSSVQSATLGQPVTFTATVKGTGTTKLPTGSVVFDDGQAPLVTQALAASGTASFTTTSLALGSHSVTATYQGDANFGSSTSVPQIIFINPPATTYSSSAIPVGTGPIAAALNPFTHTLFVANQGSNDVTAIDTRTNMILASSIPVGKAPSAIGVNRVTNQVYVANRDSADVTVIDGVAYTTTSIAVASVDHLTSPPSLLPFHPIAIAVNEQTNQIFVGSTDCDLAVIQGAGVTHPGNFLCGPIAMAASPIGGSTFVAESDDSIIEQYQRSTNFLIPGPGFTDFIAPQAVAISDPFVFAADADQGTGRVDVMNEVSGTNFQVTVGGDPYAIAVNPVDGEVYVAAQSPGAGQAAAVSAVFVSGSSGGVDAVLHAGQTPVPAPLPAPNKIAVDSTNDLVYVANEASNDVTVIDGSALAVNGAVSVGTNPRAVLVNPDNCSAYVANFGSDTVSVLTPHIIGPGICLSSNWLTFPAQLVNTKSVPQTVTLTNIGNANLLISGIVTSPNAFIESDNCGPVSPAATKAIAPGAKCQLQAAFGPTAPGLVNGQIVITDNNDGSPHSIVLTGNAVVQPTVNLTPNANPAVFGQSITLTANVSGSIGVPTGTITFYSGTNVLGIVGLTNGTASINDSLFAIGPYTFTASYSGDFIYASASSPVITETVNQASTKFSIFLSSAITSNVGDAVTFESAIQVVPPGSGNATEPNGQVTFYDGQTSLGSVTITNGQVPNFSISSLSVGSHLITAVYPGDANLLGSTSPVLTQVVVVPNSGGGGTGGGGTGGTGNTGLGISGTCGCALSGNYVDPAAPIDVATTSPHNKYNVTPGSGFITVAVPSNTNPLTIQLTAASYNWGFSPDDDRFVFHFLTSVQGQPNTQIDNIEVFDLTATPPKMIVNAQSVVGAQTSLSFSPSGRYFLLGQTTGQNAAEYQIFQVQGVTAQQLVYDSGLYNFAVGSGSDYQTVSAGFGPGTPETAFVYAYLDPNAPNPNTFIWNLVSLSTGKAFSAPVVTNGNGSFWKFNPCGTVVGLATQTSSNQASVDLFATSFVAPSAAHLPHAASGLPLSFTLLANLALQEVQYTDQSGFSQTSILTSDPSCSPNTPTGSNVVISGGPIAGASQVSVTFANVTTAGVTAIAPLLANGQCPAVPGGFQLAGTPPICFDLSTTAMYNQSLNPAITVCVTMNGSTSGLVFAHFQNGDYVNSTVTVPNEPANEICAGVQSLSPFAIFQRVPVPLTITANPVSRQYGMADPAFAVSYSGFVNGDDQSILSGQLSCKSNDTSASPVSQYTIDCSSSTLSSPNYIITFATGVLTVTPAPLTLTASNQSKVYGGALPALTFASSGFVNGDTAASLTAQPLLGTSATSASPVGTYAITISAAVDPNYSISYVSGQLSVTAAPLTISAPSPSRQYGQTNPSLSNVAYSGFVNGDNSSSLNGTLVCTTTATQTSPVGSYPITCAGLASANYTITFAPGTLNVTSATVTITANNATKVLNAANPPLNWTATGFANGETASVLTASPICITTAGLNSPVGSYPITCSGASAANYTFAFVAGTLKIQYSTSIGHVIQPPINADGTSVLNQGRTVPAKFDVYDANGVPISTPGVVTSFFLTGIVSGTVTTSVENVVDTNNPDTAFRWDGQEWIFNITTANLSAGSTYVYTIALNDGSTITFQFGLR